MEWISDDWIWGLLGLGMVGMHAFGHGHRPHGGKQEGSIDPVCGKTVDPTDAKATVHDGRDFQFCSREFREMFEANPYLYINESGKNKPDASMGIEHYPAGGARHA